MVDIIGFVSSVLGIYSFLEALFPSTPGSSDSATVRIAVGLSGTDGEDGPLTDPQGVIGSVRIYNNNGEFLSASANNQGIDDGSYKDLTLIQGNSQQAPYVQIRVGEGEAVCLAYVSVTFSDGQKRAWDGTWAEPLGLGWYYSGIFVTDSSNETGDCIWLDGAVGTIFIYMPAFSSTGDEPSSDISTYIGERGFRAYTYIDATGEISLPAARALREKRAAKAPDTRLIISDRVDHQATRRCESESSFGPSLVSLSEGTFCNMQTREVLPLCDQVTLVNCFQVPNLDSTEQMSSEGGTEFSSVLDWTS